MSFDKFRSEVAAGDRFEFGENWKNFLLKINDERIFNAQLSLTDMLEINSLSGKSFLDVGSGSGLFSLAARNLNANVTSFDFDESSVYCTAELNKRYYPNDEFWSVMQGSVLDSSFVGQLGRFDIVYSWGVLHHTGDMWSAIDNCLNLVNDGGKFCIAIYDDQGIKSQIWWVVKWIYNKLPKFLIKPFAYTSAFFINFILLLKFTIKLKPKAFFEQILNYKKHARGMSVLSDILDWYGGFPFEFSSYEKLVEFIQRKGFELQKGKRASSLGCHELVFRKI